MLSQLYIENIAVIEKAEIEFRQGFNILTGETGAGKSILIDSIHAILGERISKELVRTGAKTAFVSASFENAGTHALEKAEELGYTAEQGEPLLLQREIHADGRTVCRINGRPATVATLKELGAELINIHGQHENYGLLMPEKHIVYLDHMGALEPLCAQYQKVYEEAKRLKLELAGLQMDEAQKARQIDLLTYQIDELESANLRSGEQEELTRAQNLYRNSEKVAVSLASAKDAMDGGEDGVGAVAAVSAAADALGAAEQYLPGAKELAERMRGLAYDLEDCGEEMRGLSDGLEYDPRELEEIEARLDMLYRLGLKYGNSEEAMLTFLEDCRSQLQSIEVSDETAARLSEQFKIAKGKARELANRLSAKRQEAARVFEKNVRVELTFLDMPNLVFQVQREEGPLGPNGCDRIQFLISTNPGEPPKPISKIASGGELSRIMLAIKTVLAHTDELDTLIFDEIDTGISGSAAQKVGLKLREVSKSRQVICVTHLAQIASLASRHLQIKKQVKSGKTFTGVAPLDFEGRKQELARIIGGTQITPLTLQNAEEMLKLAGNGEG